MDSIKPAYPQINQSLILLFLTLGISLGVGIIVSLLKLALPGAIADHELISGLLMLVSYSIPLALAIWFGIRQVRRFDIPNFRLKTAKVSFPALLVMVFMTPLIGIIIDPITTLIPIPDFFNELMMGLLKPGIFTFLAVVIAAPLLEEGLFRGVILEGFLKNYSPQKAIIWSAVLFGLFHLNPWQAIPAAILGVFIGWAYWRTGSLIPCILIHLINNLTAYVMMSIFGTDANESWIDVVGLPIYLSMFALSALGLMVGYRYLNKALPQKSPEVHEKVAA